ncbi:UNKNOWN [Stylonychia lemnae]|uniref:Sulfite exporter TauE/SafE n=1 Tax=Stylonychia lemnae TaxID=5949 RepID=A0A078B0U9_STYLE|nr:UNKNOWN [Stylonychia lemnae]|eukprot:CDW86733.1 UNKNOWN [Stylonychia lemnae]
MLCTIGGIGGGGAVVPLLMSFFKFETKEAIAISGFSIFVCSLTRFIFNFKQKHPQKDVVAIDYGLASVMFPSVIFGSFIGVMINVIFPSLYLQILLTLLLIFLTYDCTKKAIVIFKKENRQAIQVKEQLENSQSITEKMINQEHNSGGKNNEQLDQSIIQDNNEDDNLKQKDQLIEKLSSKKIFKVDLSKDFQKNTSNETDINHSEIQKTRDIIFVDGSLVKNSEIQLSVIATQSQVKQVERMIQRERTHYQWNKQGICILLLVVQVLISLFRGSKKTHSIIGIGVCSFWDWFCFSFFLIFCVIICFLAVKNLQREQKLKQLVGKGLIPSDVILNPKNVRKLVGVATIGGLVSGAFGLGGGTIFNPLLLSLGVPPAVASSTGMYMILFSNLGSSITFMVYKTLQLDYGLWIGFYCSLSSIAGLYILNKVVKKYNRQSPIVIVLALMMGVSALFVPLFGIIDLVQEYKDGIDITQFNSLC